MTTAGSLALAGAHPPKDAFIVSQLREAGAVILGKTNLSEWANFRSTHSTSGWSGRGGQTRNPYALDRNPSGSSSGSGAAIAANLAAVAVGTETDGSIVSPSKNNATGRHQTDAGALEPRAASCRSRTARTRPGRWPAPSPTPRSCSARWAAPIRTIRSTRTSTARDRRLLGITRRRRIERRADRGRPQPALGL